MEYAKTSNRALIGVPEPRGPRPRKPQPAVAHGVMDEFHAPRPCLPHLRVGEGAARGVLLPRLAPGSCFCERDARGLLESQVLEDEERRDDVVVDRLLLVAFRRELLAERFDRSLVRDAVPLALGDRVRRDGADDLEQQPLRAVGKSAPLQELDHVPGDVLHGILDLLAREAAHARAQSPSRREEQRVPVEIGKLVTGSGRLVQDPPPRFGSQAWRGADFLFGPASGVGSAYFVSERPVSSSGGIERVARREGRVDLRNKPAVGERIRQD